MSIAVVLGGDVVEEGQPASRAETATPSATRESVSRKPRRNPVVAAAGDIACDPRAKSFESGVGTSRRCHQRYTAELVEELKADAVLILGDAQYENGRYWQYMQSYDPTWGRFKRISYPTPGSRSDGFGRGGYARYWGARAGPADSPWYSFDLGDWHVVSLNSNCERVGGCQSGSRQERWLRADLAEHRARCTLAFWHEPLFSSSVQAALKMEALWEVLHDSGAELVLSGDAHSYERFRPQDAAGHRDRRRGIRQFVVGTGGKSLERFEKRSAGSAVRNETTFGVLELTLRPRRYNWRFLSEAEEEIDAGSASCH